MFVSVAEGQRIEAFEVWAQARTYEALEARERAPIGSIRVGSGLAVFAGTASPLSKVAGLGFADEFGSSPELVADALEMAEGIFFDHGAPVQVELSSLAEPSVLSALTGRGYAPVGFEYVSGLRLDGPPPERASDLDNSLTVRQDGPDDEETWLDVLVTGFSVADAAGIASHESFPEDALRQSIADFTAVEGMRRYLGLRTIEGATVPAGAGGMVVAGDMAKLSGAATLAEHRGVGVQTALLRHRLADAHRAGCRLVIVTTQPGSTSLRNMQRHGFELLYVRLILVKAPPDRDEVRHD